MNSTPAVTGSSDKTNLPLDPDSKAKIITSKSAPSETKAVALKICLIVGVGAGIVGAGVVGFFASQGPLTGLLSHLQALGALGPYGSICVMAAGGTLSVGLIIWMMRSAKNSSSILKTSEATTTQKNFKETGASQKTKAGSETHQGFEACEKGNIEQLNAIIDSKEADLNAHNSNGFTLIEIAAMKGHLNIVQRLINEQVNIVPRCLLSAMIGRNLEVAKLIYDKLGFDRNEDLSVLQNVLKGLEEVLKIKKFLKNVKGLTQEETQKTKAGSEANQEGSADILEACEKGNIEQLNAIISNEEVDLNALGHILIEIAALEGHLDIVQRLIDAYVNIVPKYLLLAMIGGNFEVIKLIYGKLDPKSNVMSALQEIQENLKIEKFYIEAGSTRRQQHKETLMANQKKGPKSDSSKTVEATVKQSESLDIFDACIGGDVESLNSLIKEKKKIDLHATNDQGLTPIAVAAFSGHWSCVEALIQAGVHVNSVDDHKNTALHYAVYEGHIELVKKLIESGANLNYKNLGDSTPLDLALEQIKLVKLLREAEVSFKFKNTYGEIISILTDQGGSTTKHTLDEVEKLRASVKDINFDIPE